MPGKNNAEDIGTMIAANEQKKQNRLYRVESQEYATERIASLVRGSIEDLAALADGKQKISLADTKLLRERTIVYLRSCEASGVLPSIAGFCRSIGHSRNSVYDYMSRNPDSPSGQWLEIFKDVCGDLLATSALRGDTQPIVSIFLEKEIFGLRDTIQIESVASSGPLGDTVDSQEHARRYMSLPED